MTWPPLLRVLAPLLAGAGIAAVLQATVPDTRLYATASPGLLAGLAGLLGAGLVAGLTLARRRNAASVAAASRAALRQAADEAATERLRFLMRLDHELKNPLTAIRAGLANIEQAGPMMGTVAPAMAAGAAGTIGALSTAAGPGMVPGTALASVSAQADRITRLVGDLRKLADLEVQEIEEAPVDLADLLREVADAAQEIPGAGQRTIRVSVPQAPWPLPLIDGDRDLLFIAVENLVANAVKFSAPGDIVEIRASEDDDALLLEVADTGTGIPPDEIGQVWQELARGRAARSLPGTGIGLALVRVIVARHGGRVAIRSRDGQGTVVSIRLPVPDRSSADRFNTGPDVSGLRHHRETPGKATL
jgi:two-component system, OmpR family, sensor kinase